MTQPSATTLGSLQASGLPTTSQSAKSYATIWSPGSGPTSRSSPESMATKTRLFRNCRMRSLPDMTSSCLASAGRPKPGSPAASSSCSMNGFRSWLDPRSTTIRPARSRSRRGALVAEKGDETPIDWVPRDRRFSEKLATPDTTVADLIGEVDPIKVAEGRYLSNEEIIAFGLIPRTNRGIFNLNELPDLAERIQVGLLNILEEQDVQIRGFQVRLPLDLMVVASANPEDYTNRGRIITPLKDRFGSQIRTHYPRDDRDGKPDRRPGAATSNVRGGSTSSCRRLHAGHHQRDFPPRPAVADGVPAKRRFRADVASPIPKSSWPTPFDVRSEPVNTWRYPESRTSTRSFPPRWARSSSRRSAKGKDEDALERIVGDAIRTVFLRQRRSRNAGHRFSRRSTTVSP